MRHPLHGSRLKLNRAHHHAEALKREMRAWSRRNPYEVFGEYEPGPPEEYVFRVRFFEEPPPEWGILLGDFAHNARSALDHLACQLVLLNGGKVDRRTQFPIIVNPFQWEPKFSREGAARLDGASERHIEMIEALQPYHRPDLYGTKWVGSAIDDPLAVLSRLSNEDKHRALNTTVVALESIAYDLTTVRDVAALDLNRAQVSWDPLIDRAEILRLPITSSGPHPEVQMHRRETVQVALRHTVETVPGFALPFAAALAEEIDAIVSQVRRVFEIFVGEFG